MSDFQEFLDSSSGGRIRRRADRYIAKEYADRPDVSPMERGRLIQTYCRGYYEAIEEYLSSMAAERPYNPCENGHTTTCIKHNAEKHPNTLWCQSVRPCKREDHEVMFGTA